MRRERNPLFRIVVPVGVLGAAAFTVCTQTADGFFPPVPPPVTKATEGPPSPAPVPPVPNPVPPVPNPTPQPPEPTSTNGGSNPGRPVTPLTIPEPATITSGLLGLAVAAGWTLRRRRTEDGKKVG